MKIEEKYCKAFDELLGYPVGSALASHISDILLAHDYKIDYTNKACIMTSGPYRLATIPFTSKSNILPFDIGANLTTVYYDEQKISIGLYPNRLDDSHRTSKCFFQMKSLHDIDFDQIKYDIENYDLFGESLSALKSSRHDDLRYFLHNKRRSQEFLDVYLGKSFRLYCEAHDHKHADYRRVLNGRGNAIAFHYHDDIISCSDCNNLLQAYIDYINLERDDRNKDFADFMISSLAV